MIVRPLIFPQINWQALNIAFNECGKSEHATRVLDAKHIALNDPRAFPLFLAEHIIPATVFDYVSVGFVITGDEIDLQEVQNVFSTMRFSVIESNRKASMAIATATVAEWFEINQIKCKSAVIIEFQQQIANCLDTAMLTNIWEKNK